MAFSRQEQQFFERYCTKYFIPREFFMMILEDSKVVPMIRGKATEYNALVYLKNNLNVLDFSVEKLNLNPQQAIYDEDVTITHRMTGERFKVEVKNACRGEFTNGRRTKIMRNIPHYKVKCHKSRSSLEKAGSTNDRYLVGDFDLVACTPLNSIYEGATYSRELQFIDDANLQIIKDYYGVHTNRQLEEACNDDWRFAFSDDIAEDYTGVMAIPRTPYVALDTALDPHWFKIDELPRRLEQKAIARRRMR